MLGRLILRGLCLASLAACASARPVFEMRPIKNGAFNAQWVDVLRTRYQCDDAVVGPALAAVRDGYAIASIPLATTVGSLVCDLVGLTWPERVRAFATDSGIVEQWEFRFPQQQEGHPGTRANIYGRNPAQGRGIAVGPEDNMTMVMFLVGPRPHLLRVVRIGT